MTLDMLCFDMTLRMNVIVSVIIQMYLVSVQLEVQYEGNRGYTVDTRK